MKTAKKTAMERALSAAGRNIPEAAKLLGVCELTVKKYMRLVRKEEYDRDRARLERHRKLKGLK